MDTVIVCQPVLDDDEELVSYELRYHDYAPGAAEDAGADTAIGMLDDTVVTALTRGIRAYVTVPGDELVSDEPLALPESFDIGVPSDLGPRDDVLAACRRRREAGRRLTLVDRGGLNEWRPHRNLFTGIVVEFNIHESLERRKLPAAFGVEERPVMAHGIESRADFESARDAGYTAFHGPFLFEPPTLRGGAAQVVKATALNLLAEVNRPELDYDAVEAIVKRDPAVSYALLRYVNSAAFAVKREISSLRQALVLLGEKEFRKWASLFAVADLADGRPSELLILAITRARFTELAASATGQAGRADEAFLTGLLSVIDALLNCTVAEAIKDIPVSRELKAALFGMENPLRALLDLVISHEAGRWAELASRLEQVGMTPTVCNTLYIEAVSWAFNVATG